MTPGWLDNGRPGGPASQPVDDRDRQRPDVDKAPRTVGDAW